MIGRNFLKVLEHTLAHDVDDEEFKNDLDALSKKLQDETARMSYV